MQSDLVSTATHWCMPWLAANPGYPVVGRAPALLNLLDNTYVMGAPNLPSVQAALPPHALGRLEPQERVMAEAFIEFMGRGH